MNIRNVTFALALLGLLSVHSAGQENPARKALEAMKATFPADAVVRFAETDYAPDYLAKAVPHLKQLKSLEAIEITFGGGVVDDKGLRHLSELKDLPKLKRLILNFSKVTDAGLLQLKPLGKLEEINLVGSKEVTGDGAKALLKEMPKLKKIVVTLDLTVER
jgi:hypothetical protein